MVNATNIKGYILIARGIFALQCREEIRYVLDKLK